MLACTFSMCNFCLARQFPGSKSLPAYIHKRQKIELVGENSADGCAEWEVCSSLRSYATCWVHSFLGGHLAVDSVDNHGTQLASGMNVVILFSVIFRFFIVLLFGIASRSDFCAAVQFTKFVWLAS